MPLPQNRPSLKTSLSERYAQQTVGGAYDAKDIIENGNDPLFSSYQGSKFQINNGFLTKEKIMVSNFKNNGNDLSQFVQNLSTVAYDSAAAGIPAGLS